MRYIASRKRISPVAASVVCSLFPRHQLLAGIICEYSLRFSEALSLSAQDVYCSKTLIIHQGKTGVRKRINNNCRVSYFDCSVPSGSDLLFPSSYDALRRDIQCKLPQPWRSYSHQFCDATHIFRHMNATFYFENGVSVNKIAIILGHNSLDSVACYLHT
jgi:integrase